MAPLFVPQIKFSNPAIQMKSFFGSEFGKKKSSIVFIGMKCDAVDAWVVSVSEGNTSRERGNVGGITGRS